jgi:hypothetical protein
MEKLRMGILGREVLPLATTGLKAANAGEKQ